MGSRLTCHQAQSGFQFIWREWSKAFRLRHPEGYNAKTNRLRGGRGFLLLLYYGIVQHSAMGASGAFIARIGRGELLFLYLTRKKPRKCFAT